jgi:transposase
MKLSLITNEKGIPLNIDLFKGNLNDINIFNKQLDKLDIKLFNNKSTIFMADAGYDSIKLRKRLNDTFYKLIIPFNKRNTKDVNKIKTLTNEEKKLYKSRIAIENTFLKI